MANLKERLKHAWNAFSRTDDPPRSAAGYVTSFGSRPDRPRVLISNERSIISSIYTRLGIDCAGVEIRHVRTDDQERYLEDIDSGLNNCLTARGQPRPSRSYVPAGHRHDALRQGRRRHRSGGHHHQPGQTMAGSTSRPCGWVTS